MLTSDPRTRVLLWCKWGRITLTLEGNRVTKGFRRQIALGLVKGIHEELEKLGKPFIDHMDGHGLQWMKEMERGIRLRNAPNLETELGREGFKIRMARLDLGWSQEELARRAQIQRSHLSALELGKRRPRAATLRRIQIALHERKSETLPAP